MWTLLETFLSGIQGNLKKPEIIDQRLFVIKLITFLNNFEIILIFWYFYKNLTNFVSLSHKSVYKIHTQTSLTFTQNLARLSVQVLPTWSFSLTWKKASWENKQESRHSVNLRVVLFDVRTFFHFSKKVQWKQWMESMQFLKFLQNLLRNKEEKMREAFRQRDEKCYAVRNEKKLPLLRNFLIFFLS